MAFHIAALPYPGGCQRELTKQNARNPEISIPFQHAKSRGENEGHCLRRRQQKGTVTEIP
jgi:hypothetical protein